MDNAYYMQSLGLKSRPPQKKKIY